MAKARKRLMDEDLRQRLDCAANRLLGLRDERLDKWDAHEMHDLLDALDEQINDLLSHIKNERVA